MDFMSYGVSIIERKIPREILDLVFSKRGVYSLEHMIEMNILRGMLAVDLNLLRGVELVVPIDKCLVHTETDGAYIEIPQDILKGRKIVSVLSLASTAYMSRQHGGLDGAMEKMGMNTIGGYYGFANTDMEIVSDSEIWVDNFTYSGGMTLRIVVEYSSRLHEINPRSNVHLIKVFELAAKYYIYTKLIIKLNNGELYHGASLDTIKEIVDSYSEAGDEYNEHLITVVSKILFMNDRVAMGSYVTSIILNN